jgi:carboxyl-terminal processing protease
LKRVYKWLAWIVGVPVVGFALLVAAALWTVHQREGKFARLQAPGRQLAIYDAFARTVEANYYDRDFVEQRWPALRDEWRAEAQKTRNDLDLYFKVLLQLTQKLPSSHFMALPPPRPTQPSPGADAPGQHAHQQVLGTGGFDIAQIRRGRGSLGLVDQVDAGSPAAVAGIEPGWRVIAFKSCDAGSEVTAVFMTAMSPAERLEVEAGGTVKLPDTGIRTAAEFDRRYNRSVTYRCHELTERAPFEERELGGILYLRFDTFMRPELIDQVLGALDRAGEHGVILDLRSNHGGLRDEMLRLMNRLLPGGSLVVTEFMQSGEYPYRADGRNTFTRPLAVLIGPRTASAAEITAAALQDQHRARLFGRPTAGATLTSRSFLLPDGGTAQIAIADVQRASGARIEAVGVIPDVGFMPTLDDVRAGRDPALERALAELKAARATASTGSPPPAG